MLGPGERVRWSTEVAALRLLGGVAGVPVPEVRVHGVTADGTGYVLMTRLAGVRWSDRRATLDAGTATALTAAVGATLRRVHTVAGPRFGHLTATGTTWATAWDSVAARATALLAEHRRVAGVCAFDAGVRAIVGDNRGAFEACAGPVLCHRDLVDANLLLDDLRPARVAGVVDLERAAWDDPMADLALTRVHVRQHVPADVGALLDGYGGLTAEEVTRADVHEVLHLLAERSWVAVDQPSGWRESVERLDGLLQERV